MIDEMIAELRNTHWKNSRVRRPDEVQRGAPYWEWAAEEVWKAEAEEGEICELRIAGCPSRLPIPVDEFGREIARSLQQPRGEWKSLAILHFTERESPPHKGAYSPRAWGPQVF